MQTFLPYPSFQKSAQVLDRQRLGKQRVEAWQLYLSLTDPDYGWKNHPASKMWKGYELSLLTYGFDICNEWISRGYKDTLRPRFLSKMELHPYSCPLWFYDERFHLSHQSNLIRKLPDHYGPLFPGVPDNLPYYWPI